MIEFRNIEKSFFGVNVLKGVSFTVPPGQYRWLADVILPFSKVG